MTNQMKIHKAAWHNIPEEHKVGQIADSVHYDAVVKEPTLVYTKGRMVAAYLTPNIDMEPLRELLLSVKMSGSFKDGVRVYSRQFGHQTTGPTDFESKYPAEYKILVQYGKEIARGYELVNPGEYKQHQRDADSIPEKCKMEGTFFTNGLINRDAILRYHFDAGNFPAARTCTYNIRKGTMGGLLVFPALRLAFECADKTMCIFDGNMLLHGVTPIRKLSNDGYRFSVLYYTMKALSENAGPEINEILKVDHLHN